jgi:hypothetical protein
MAVDSNHVSAATVTASGNSTCCPLLGTFTLADENGSVHPLLIGSPRRAAWPA